MTLKKFMKHLTMANFILVMAAGFDMTCFMLCRRSFFFGHWFFSMIFIFFVLMLSACTLIALYEMFFVPESKKHWLKKWIG